MAPAQTSGDTTMGEALRRAGVTTAKQRLDRLARRAWEEFPAGNAMADRRKVIREAMMSEMFWTLVEEWQPSAIGKAVGWLLDRAAEQIREEVEIKAAKASGRKKPKLELVQPEPEPARSAHARREEKRAAVLVKAAVKLSKLDTFMVNGQPIGDVTPEEALDWAASRERDVRFVTMLTGSLPPGRPIRDSWHGDEVDKVYELAERAASNDGPIHEPPKSRTH